MRWYQRPIVWTAPSDLSVMLIWAHEELAEWEENPTNDELLDVIGCMSYLIKAEPNCSTCIQFLISIDNGTLQSLEAAIRRVTLKDRLLWRFKQFKRYRFNVLYYRSEKRIILFLIHNKLKNG